jgi:hypothetical protein
MSFRFRYRPVTFFGPPLPTFTVFRPRLPKRYHTVAIPLPYRYIPLLNVTHRYSPFPTVACNGEERSVMVTVSKGG